MEREDRGAALARRREGVERRGAARCARRTEAAGSRSRASRTPPRSRRRERRAAPLERAGQAPELVAAGQLNPSPPRSAAAAIDRPALPAPTTASGNGRSLASSAAAPGGLVPVLASEIPDGWSAVLGVGAGRTRLVRALCGSRPRRNYSTRRAARPRPDYHRVDADLRVRVRGMREPLRGARRTPGPRRVDCRVCTRSGRGGCYSRSGPRRSASSRRRREARRQERSNAELRERTKAALRGAAPPAKRGQPRGERVSASAEERRERAGRGLPRGLRVHQCPLSETRTNVVFGAGNADADLMFVGEAPGAEEDRQGLPFVGRAGELLTQLLEGIGLTREDVFIANVLKCRPPGNRDPQPVEIESCQPYTRSPGGADRAAGDRDARQLRHQAAHRKPRSGSPGCGAPRSCDEIGGRTVFLMPLLHPAAALRTPVAGRHPARGLRQAARADRRPASRGRRSARGRPSSPEAPVRRLPSARQSARPVRRLTTERSSSPARDRGDRGAARRRSWARRLVLVGGELGAGKTTLIRGACRELGVTEPVVSPTFTIGHRYRGRVPVSHLDLYRLESLGGRGPGAARRLPDLRRGGLRRVAGGGRAAARRTENRPARRAPPRRRRLA